MDDTSTRPRPLPPALRRGLGQIDRRLRVLGLGRGLGTAGLVLALAAAVGMAADVGWVLPWGVRYAIWGAWVAASAVALVSAALGPIARRQTWAELAAVAESGAPALDEQLTSSVELLAGRAHGSPAL